MAGMVGENMRTIAALLSVMLVGCASAPHSNNPPAPLDAAVVASDASTDASTDALDTPAFIAPGCGENFIEVDYTLPSGERRQVCRSSMQGLGAHYEQCRRAFVETEFLGEVSPVVATWRVRERQGFLATGQSMMQFVAASPLGPGNCPSVDQPCFKFADCPVTVTTAGRVGDRVEAILTVPCELRHADDPGRVVTVHRARVVGRLSLAYTGVQPHDGGFVGSGPQCDY